jgi:hypothetical protein
VVASQVADLTARVPKAIAGAPPILKADHVASEWPITLNELASILNKPLNGLRLLLQLPDGGRWDRSEARGCASELLRQGAPPLPRFPATRFAPPPPAHAWSRRHPLGVVGEPAAGRIPSVPPVGGWSRLGASSRPQIGRWDRRQCHMPDFWVTGRPRNPLNASAATFCAAGVISMHQTSPGMVRGVSGVSRGRFLTISAGSHSESNAPPLQLANDMENLQRALQGRADRMRQSSADERDSDDLRGHFTEEEDDPTLQGTGPEVGLSRAVYHAMRRSEEAHRYVCDPRGIRRTSI